MGRTSLGLHFTSTTRPGSASRISTQIVSETSTQSASSSPAGSSFLQAVSFDPMRRLSTAPRLTRKMGGHRVLYREAPRTNSAKREDKMLQKLTILALFACAFCWTTAAQDQGKAPKLLILEREEIKPGKVTAHTQAASRFVQLAEKNQAGDRKSTRLNSSHGYISYAVFCLKKKKKNITHRKRKVTDKVSCSTNKERLRISYCHHKQ